MNLLDAERRWSYTVFLQVLARYLDYRIELGLIDSHYAYGRAALLHYARWMVDHEYPYLEKPAILEYPTETWAAQDMRKCDVFLFAAGHACGDDRRRFLEGAARFFEYSVSTLHELPTRTLARPLVLMLTNGYLHLSPDASAPRPEGPVDIRLRRALDVRAAESAGQTADCDDRVRRCAGDYGHGSRADLRAPDKCCR